MVITVGEDITELKAIEAQLRAANENLERRVAERTAELQAALRELESFSYSVSHDLRAPARAVAGFSRILADDFGPQLPGEAQRLLARVTKAGEAMGAMVDGLLELSRITRKEIARQPVDLVALAAEVWHDLAALEPERNVELHLPEALWAEADPVLLRNLLLNLLGNARKYTRHRPEARVWLGRNDAGEYFVRDNGAGFEMRYADKLFGAFQRLHTEREFEGYGIGLALAKRIVERHGGAIRAEAAPGEGATFLFALGETLPGAAT
jgi:signal transduction histidine kinase